MSSGHGALHLTGIFKLPLEMIGLIFVLKALASVISLGSGFRGGLFFASLLLGALGGQLFATGLASVMPGIRLDPDAYAIIGLSALSVSVIGGDAGTYRLAVLVRPAGSSVASAAQWTTPALSALLLTPTSKLGATPVFLGLSRLKSGSSSHSPSKQR